MKLAILGTDSDILQLAAAARAAGHEIAWLGDVRAEDAAKIASLVRDASDRASEWELLLGQGVVDGVLVGRGRTAGDVRAEQIKRLVTEAVPLLIVHPLFESVLPYYEIDMARGESGGMVQHYHPLPDRRALEEFAQWVHNGDSAIGPIHQVTCERRTRDSSRSAVLALLARDVELLSALTGDIRRISAVGPATSDASFASLQVQMSATNTSSLRWSVGATSLGAPGRQLTLLGEYGTVVLRETSDGNGNLKWQIESRTNDDDHTAPVAEHDPAAVAIGQFATGGPSTWTTAVRDMEVVDAVELSLQKGRTIEVFQQQLTERLAFRGTMAAIGCGLLLVAFLAVTGIAVLGGAEGMMRQKMLPAWPLVLLAVLAFFLFLQAIPLLVRSSSHDVDDQSG